MSSERHGKGSAEGTLLGGAVTGLFSPGNTRDRDHAIAVAVAGPIRLTLENLTPEQVAEVLYQVGYCRHCGYDHKGGKEPVYGCRYMRDYLDLNGRM